MRTPPRNSGASKPAAFTMLELLVAMAIGAVVITLGVLIFSNFSKVARPSGSFVTLPLGATVMQNFYALNQANIDAWVAPNYGQRAKADTLRDLLWDDISKANAVFCLGRAAGVAKMNTVHPANIPVPTGFQGQSLDLPNVFLSLLVSSGLAADGLFTAYRGACLSQNLSIFIMQPAADVTALSVRAVYDVDLISATATDGITTGTYVSVRRYSGGVMTDYYDVFYPTGPGAVAFNPLAVAFERAARLSLVEGTAIDRLKIAASRPFYFVWWPDPAMPALESTTGGSFDAADPRSAYPNMGGRTSLFFTIPMFPAL